MKHVHAGIAQLVEHRLPKPRVAGSSPVSRFFILSKFFYKGGKTKKAPILAIK
jgi:hypothetical protein